MLLARGPLIMNSLNVQATTTNAEELGVFEPPTRGFEATCQYPINYIYQFLTKIHAPII